MIRHRTNRLRLAASWMLAFGLIAPTASLSADPLSLKERITVESAAITLGDIFDGVPSSKAEREILRAPEAGRSRPLTAKLLNRIADQNGLNWESADVGTLTTVYRRSHKVPRDVVISAIKRKLVQRGVQDDVTVMLNGADLGLELPTTLPLTVRLEDFAYRRNTRRFSTRVHAPAGGESYAGTTVTGQVVRMVQVPVLNARVSRGETIRETDIRWVERPSDDIRSNHITDAEDLIGNNARRPLSANELLRTTAVEEPILVEDGSLVTLRLNTMQMELSAKGRALDDGTEADTIRVENIQSERVVTGTVTAPGVVVVEPSSLQTN